MSTNQSGSWFKWSARGGLSSIAVRYGFTLLLTLGALLVRHGFSPALQHSMLFAFFAIAITLSAGLGGLGPGLFATVLGTLMVLYWFIEPIGSFAINGPQALSEVVTFLVVGGLLSLTIELLRHAWRRAGEHENRFRILFERSAMGNVLVDPASGRFLLVNRKFCELTGYNEAALLGMTVQSLIPPKDREESRKNFERLGRGELGEYASRMRLLNASGQAIWAEALVTVMHAPDGRPLYCIANLQEVTRRKQRDDALRESEARYRQVLHAAGSVIEGVDAAGRVTLYSGFAEQIFGYTAEEVLGREVVGTIVPPFDSQGRDMRPVIAELIDRVDRHLYYENENLTKDGRRLWMAWTNRPIPEPGGRLREVICVGLDQTERRRTEEALRQSEERFRTAYEQAPLGVEQVALDGRLMEVNETLCRLLGYTREELLGRSFDEITHPEDREAQDKLIQKLLRGAIVSYQLDKRYLRKDGEAV